MALLVAAYGAVLLALILALGAASAQQTAADCKAGQFFEPAVAVRVRGALASVCKRPAGNQSAGTSQTCRSTRRSVLVGQTGTETPPPHALHLHTRTQACRTCPDGRVSAQDGASNCTACPLGLTHSEDRTFCVACPADFVGAVSSLPSSVRGGTCEFCANPLSAIAPGTCAAGTGRQRCTVGAECVACPPGTSASTSADRPIDTCVACPRNTYSSGSGATSCTACPTNKGFLGRGAASEAACNVTHLPDVTASVREVISVATTTVITLNGQEQRSDSQVDSSPRSVQARSGETVVPTFSGLPADFDTDLLDYAVYALPGGAWLVHVQRTDGKTATCAFAAGTATADCEYIRRTAASGASSATWYGKLTLDLGGQGSGSGSGGGGGGGGGGGAVVPGSSAPGPSTKSPGSPSAAPPPGSGGNGASPGGTVSAALAWAMAAVLAACLVVQPW